MGDKVSTRWLFVVGVYNLCVDENENKKKKKNNGAGNYTRHV